MEKRDNKNGIRFLAGCLLTVLLGFMVLSALAMYQSGMEKQRQLAVSLQQAEMELAIRRMAETQRIALETSAEENSRLESENREERKSSFLKRDKESLLILVNPWNSLPENYEPRITEIGDGMLFDERAAGALKEMLAACRAEGIVAVPISGYRTQEYQQGLFDNKVERLLSTGWPAETVENEAAKSVAVPGTSEHQLGLAMDILDENNPNLDNSQEWTSAQMWLKEHCTEYGFILRYPNGTSDITGIIFEPWHYRYVGKSVAADIAASGLTFEEYLEGD